MKSFAEFLQEKTGGAAAEERKVRLDDWLDAVNRLNKRLREWLDQSDPNGVLSVVSFPIVLAEQSLGSYRVDSIIIQLGEQSVHVLPVGRDVVAHIGGSVGNALHAAGRVDITNGVQKFPLYRVLNSGERWYLADFDEQPCELSREKFEQVLQELLA